MDTSLERVDELFHMARRMRRIALQSAVGGMALSIVGMLIAFGGWLPPVGGAVFQEIIDLAAVLNALRAAVPGGALSDYDASPLGHRQVSRPSHWRDVPLPRRGFGKPAHWRRSRKSLNGGASARRPGAAPRANGPRRPNDHRG